MQSDWTHWLGHESVHPALLAFDLDVPVHLCRKPANEVLLLFCKVEILFGLANVDSGLITVHFGHNDIHKDQFEEESLGKELGEFVDRNSSIDSYHSLKTHCFQGHHQYFRDHLIVFDDEHVFLGGVNDGGLPHLDIALRGHAV